MVLGCSFLSNESSFSILEVSVFWFADWEDPYCIVVQLKVNGCLASLMSHAVCTYSTDIHMYKMWNHALRIPQNRAWLQVTQWQWLNMWDLLSPKHPICAKTSCDTGLGMIVYAQLISSSVLQICITKVTGQINDSDSTIYSMLLLSKTKVWKCIASFM